MVAKLIAWRWQSVFARPPPANIESKKDEAVIGARGRSRPVSNCAGVAEQEDADALAALGATHLAGSNPVSRTNRK